jgi:hypothetical protein
VSRVSQLPRPAPCTGPALAALTDTRQAFDQTLAAAPADLSDLEAAAESHSYGYHGQATRILADLVTDFADIRPLLDAPQPVTTRGRLCRTAGQMAGMTAIVLHDLGSRREARARHRQLHAWGTPARRWWV